MRVPLLDLKAQYVTIREEVREAVDRVLESQQFILGAEVTALEEAVAHPELTHVQQEYVVDRLATFYRDSAGTR